MALFEFDVFLSHAAADARDADAVAEALIAQGYTVYRDRIDDPLLDRTKVTRETADRLRTRMRSCNALVYVVTAHARHSRWMPWELGYFDGLRGKVLVYPVDEAALASARDQQYLQLFTIMTPGSLAEQLGRGPAQIVQLDDGLAELRAQLQKRELFGPAAQRHTVAFREGLREAATDPVQLPTFVGYQQEIWTAWLRLWGLAK